MLPSHLKYVFLEEGGHKPVIINNLFSDKEEYKLIQVLKENQKAMGWALSNGRGLQAASSTTTLFES